MAVITASPKNFSRLLELQEHANANLTTIKLLMEAARITDIATLAQTKRIDNDGDRLEVIEKDQLEVEQKSLKVQEDQLRAMQEMQRMAAENAVAITAVADQFKTVSGPIDRIRESFQSLKSSLKENISPSGIASRMMKATNIGGVFNKRLASNEFVKQQQALGSGKSEKDLRADFKIANEVAKNIKQNEEQIKALEKLSGLSIDKLKETPKGRELLERRGSLTSEYAKVDVRGGLVSEQPEGMSNIPMPAASLAPPTESAATNKYAQEKELRNEAIKRDEEQNDLLSKIEENTRGASPEQTAKPSESGGGLLGGIGKGLAALAGGLGRGFQAMLTGVGRGLMVLSKGLLALTPAIPVIGVLTLAAIGLGAALRLAAPAIEVFGDVIMKLADVIGTVFVAAIETIPSVLGGIKDIIVAIGSSIVDIVDAVTTSIERLAEVDGLNLAKVGGGLAAIAAGLVAFSGASAVAGVSNLVGGLFRKVTGQKSTTEQLEEMAVLGPNLEKAGIGIEKLGGGLSALSSIDTEKIKAISELPLEKLAAVGASMQTPAGSVVAGSEQNASLAVSGGGSGIGQQTNVVNAPVNNISRQTQIIPAPIRNREHSQNTYLGSRYAW
jgi:hypothetical protein